MTHTLPIALTWDGQPARPDERVELRIEVAGGCLWIHVDAPFHGDPAPTAPPGPTPALWEHEVVELFVLGADQRYTEIELGPHGHHLVLQLAGTRNVVAERLPIDFQARIHGDRWRGAANLPLELLPLGPHRLNATAIHGVGAERRYLSWVALPAEKPDFHQLHRFMNIELL